MISTMLIKAVAAVFLAVSVQPMAELEAVEHTEPCRVCGEATAEDSLFDGYCPECWDIAEDGGYCDACGELLAGSTDFIVCDCHGIHGLVCRECSEWHEDFE